MLEVIGAGWGRTGTLSLKVALERLGFGPCYHAIEAMKHPEHAAAWQAAAAGEPGWMNVLDGYRATVDFPGAAYWRELVDAFSGAKVVLTVRDPRPWYASVRETFLEGHDGVAAGADDMLRQAGRSEQEAADFGAGLEAMMGGFQDVLRSEEQAVAAFERHNADVVAYVPADRLLVFEVEQGWAPLCTFLGVEPPEDEPFPHVNEAAAFDEVIPQLIADDDRES